MGSNYFTLIPANNFIWNRKEFIQFLIDHQTQPISISTNNEGVCLTATGVYELLEQFNYTEVTIITNNMLETHPVFRVQYTSPFMYFLIDHNNYSHLHKWGQQKIFGCFYNRPLWHRLGLAAILQHDYYQHTSLNIRQSIQNEDQRSLFEIDQLFRNHPESLAKFSKVCNSWPLMLEDQDGYTVNNNTTGHTDQLAQFYTDFLIDIVAETWTVGNTFFSTEKTIRPMLLKKPFIIMGSKNYLCYLRQLGFMTFNEFWSEEYDGYGGQERYVKILQLIDEISKKSKSELNDMYWSMKYTLDHNYNLLTTQTYTTDITYVN
jgi:hypothetical protein